MNTNARSDWPRCCLRCVRAAVARGLPPVPDRPGVLERRRHGAVRRDDARSTGTNGENFWVGNRLETTSAAGVKQQFVFPANLPSSDTASRSVLIATASFAALGLVTPDYTVPDGFIPRGGGTLDYASGTDQITFPALPTDGATAINRNGQPVAATPTNFAGATATLTATPPPPTYPISTSTD